MFALSQVYTFAMAVAAVGWIALVIAPHRRGVNWWLCGVSLPLVLAAVCIYTLIAYPGTFQQRFLTFQEMGGTFDNRAILMDAWSHILAADLVVGAWMARRAMRIGIPHFTLAIVLLVTYAFSPGGLALYFAVTAFRGKLTELGDDVMRAENV